jgi:hypothetical protein
LNSSKSLRFTPRRVHTTPLTTGYRSHAHSGAAVFQNGWESAVCRWSFSLLHLRGAFDGYTGTGVFWNAPTRLLDGFKLLAVPETGINVGLDLGQTADYTALAVLEDVSANL